jgi:tetratricopeptide (TPR) repeat protein
MDKPLSAEYRSDYAALLMSLGAHYAATDRPAQAEAANEEAIAIRRRLVEDHPDRVEFANDLGLSYYSMAYMMNWKRDHQATYDWAGRAIQFFEASLRREPRRQDLRELLGFAHHARAQALTSLRRPAEALAEWDRAIELARDGDVRIHSLRASRALVLAYQGEFHSALEEVTTIPTTGPDSGLIHYNEACLFAVAAAAEAKDVVRSPADRALLVEGYALRALASLAEARRAGYFREPSKVARMQSDKDLDPLRSRPDFQALLMDLAMPADPFTRTD